MTNDISALVDYLNTHAEFWSLRFNPHLEVGMTLGPYYAVLRERNIENLPLWSEFKGGDILVVAKAYVSTRDVFEVYSRSVQAALQGLVNDIKEAPNR